MSRLWAEGTATGIGSLPFLDVDEAARVVVGETPALPYLAELPGRGPGADMIGRTAALLTDLHIDLQPSGWRLVGRAGGDEQRALDHLRRDLDALEIAAYGHTGPVKVQVCGPLTLAATLQTERGNPVVGDHGARRDLAQSLAAGVVDHLAEIRRRLPNAQPLLQLDEPSAPAVLGGQVPTPSGLGTLRAVHPPEARSLLQEVIEGAGVPAIVHGCAPRSPYRLFHSAGAVGLTVDVGALSPAEWETVAELVEAGTGIIAGVVPARRPDAPLPSVREAVDSLSRPWRSVGLPQTALVDVAVAPTCGLAGWSPPGARTVMTRTREVATALRSGTIGE